MSTPSAKDMLRRLKKIEEAEKKDLLNEHGPEDNAGFQSGKDVGFQSKDDHSNPVKRVRDSGVQDAPMSFDGNDKDLDTKTGNERNPGSDESPDEFDADNTPISDNHKRRKGGSGTIPAAEGAAKDFAAFRDKIRTAMFGLSLSDKKNKGNDGSLN